MHNRIKWILILVIISLSRPAWSQIFVPTMFWKPKMTPTSFPFTAPANYTLSDNDNFAVQAGWLTLLPLDKIDDTQADFNSGLNLGTKWDAPGTALSMQNPYTVRAAQELAPSWTPDYANITAYYKFNNSLAPTVGTVTPVDNATTNNASGKLNQARRFTPNQYLNFGAAAFAALGTADFSISGWFNLASLPGTAYALMSTRNDGSCNHAWWTLFARSSGISIEVCPNNQGFSSTIPLTANTWYFFTITRSGTNMTFYINGEFDVSHVLVAGQNFANIDGLLMGVQAGGSWWLNGSLDDIAFWDVALSASQVKDLYTGYDDNRVINTPQELSSTWTPKWSNLVGYWKMNNNWNDSSGNGVNGTAQGGPVFTTSSYIGSHAGDFSANNTALTNLGNYTSIANRPTTQMAMSAWVYSTANSSTWEVILANWGASVGAFHFAKDPTNSLNLNMHQSNGTAVAISEGTAFPLNRWVHVAAVADGTFLRLYRDGEEVGTAIGYNGTINSAGPCFALGGKLNDDCIVASTYGYRNRIDDVAFWNTSLTAEEIKTIYKAQAPYYSGGEFDSSWTPKYNNILAYYNMNNGFLSAKGNYPMTTTLGTPVISSYSKLGSGSVYLTDASMLGNSTLMNGMTNQTFSLSLWSKRTQNSAGDYIIGGGQTSGTRVSLHFGYRTNNFFTFAFYADDLDTTRAYPDAGEWVHWVGTYNAGTKSRKLYRNGVLENSNTAGGNFAGTGYVCIGGVTQASATCTSANGGYKGNVDEIAFWQAELSAAEVQTIYERQKSQFQGEFISRVMGTAGTTPAWLSQAWITPIPFYKEMPDGGTSETTANYPSLVANLETNLLRLWHMNETAGTTIANATGVADNLTVTAGTLGKDGVFKNALEVNGTAGYAISSSITGTSVATLSAWVYLTAYPAAGTKSNLVCMANTNAATSYDKNLFIDSVGRMGFYTWSGAGHEANSTVSIPLNTWTHIAGTVDGTNTKTYINGVEVATTSSGGSSQPTNSVLVGGYTNGYPAASDRIVDEVALWSRALTGPEVLQLYRRGNNRVKFQVRSCLNSTCSGESWRGPDGTSGSYYSELFNQSVQGPTPSGTVLATSPIMTFANFPPALANRPFYQYRTIFESDDPTYVPSVKTVTVSAPAITYPSNDKYAISMFTESFVFKHLYSFTTLEDNVPCVNTYQISKDGTNFYYFNGTVWAVGDTTTTSQRNSAPTISSNLPSFNSQINNSGAGGTGNFYLRAFLEGNGSRACYIDNIAIQYD